MSKYAKVIKLLAKYSAKDHGGRKIVRIPIGHKYQKIYCKGIDYEYTQ